MVGMEIKEIQAKVLVASVKQPDLFFGLKYNMNLYNGCMHRCLCLRTQSTPSADSLIE
jgi:DNA repair photolyase